MSTTSRTDAHIARLRLDPEASGCDRTLSFARTLETELAAAKAEAAHYMSVAQKATDDLTRLRAELKELSQAYELNRVSIDELDADRARAEKAEAEVERLTATLSAIEEDGTSEHNAAVGLRQNLVAAIARAERFEAERDAFAKDKARLDWLSVSDAWFDYPATGAFTPDTMRAAIDAAMKEEIK